MSRTVTQARAEAQTLRERADSDQQSASSQDDEGRKAQYERAANDLVQQAVALETQADNDEERANRLKQEGEALQNQAKQKFDEADKITGSSGFSLF